MEEPYKIVTHPMGFRSVEPLPSTDELEKFYADLYYQQPQSTTYHTSYSDEELQHKCVRSELPFVALAELSVTGGKLLEVGCGEGFILAEAASRGFEVTGIDYSNHAIASFHPELLPKFQAGDAIEILRREVEGGGTFDVCFLQNVLEHVPDPESLLSLIQSALGERGTLVVTVPNDFSALQLKVLGAGVVDEEFWLAPPQHLHYFTAENLSTFLTSLGYCILDQFADFPVDWFLLHPEANYVRDPSRGKSAHNARLTLDLLLREQGPSNYLAFYRGLAKCGGGRNVTTIASITKK